MTPDRDYPRPSIAFVVAAPATAEAFLAPHINRLAPDYKITAVGKGISKSTKLDARVILKDIDIERPISPIADLKASFELFKLFRQERFELVQSMTPKAGLLTAIAGFLARVPVRIHWFTGQVWATKSGILRQLLKNLDRLTARLSTHLLVDSHSQMQYLSDNHISRDHKMRVLANGSTCGVDLAEVEANQRDPLKIRKSLGIDSTAVVILFVGRLNREKGIPELLEAFGGLNTEVETHLILAGEDEEELKKSEDTASLENAFVHFVGYQRQIFDFMREADIFILPSHREGLPISLLEAGAHGLAIVATRINGIIDVVQGNDLGILVTPQDPLELRAAIEFLINNPVYRTQLGASIQDLIFANFAQQDLVVAYRDLLFEVCAHARRDQLK